MPTVQGFVRCDAGSLWLVIMPKSKDRFMERPPMKTVQPWPCFDEQQSCHADPE
jgi:hypothetical protein